MHPHRRAIGAWAAVLGTVAIVCLASSLFGRLGFAFSFVLTPFSVLAALHLGTRVARSAAPDASPLGLLARGLACVGPLLAAPLAVMAASAPFSKSCGVWSGLAWYALLPGVSSLVALEVGLAVGTLRPRRAFGVALGVALGSLGLSLWWVYRYLPVAVYDPFWGYFPGSLYDEQVSVRAPLLWARLYHVLGASALFALASRARTGWRVLVGGVLAIGAVAVGVNGSRLGFRYTTAGIAAALGGRSETAHITLYYRAGTSAARVERLARECEFRYARLVELLGRGPARIEIFFFDSAADKQRYTGLSGTSVARPWQQQIVTHALDVPHESLNHELVHAFFGEYGDGLFGLPLSGGHLATGLVEGVAVALDDDDSDEEVHGLSQTMAKAKLLPPLDELMSPRFLLHPPTRAYVAAGSFCRFLVSRYGADKLPRLYHSGGTGAAFVAELGKPLATLEAEWQRFLDERPPPKTTAEARDALQRPSIFARRCSHELATKRAAAFAAMARDVDVGLRMLEEICSEDPDRPEHLGLLLKEALGRHRPRLAERVAWRLLSHPEAGEKSKAQASEALGDLAILSGDRFSALGYFKLASRAPADPPVGRLRFVKEYAAALPPGELADTMVKYLYEERDKPQRAAELVRLHPENGLYQYLLGRQRSASSDPSVLRGALVALQQALALGLPDDRFVREALHVGIDAALSLSAYDEALRFAETLGKVGDPSAGVWQRRIAFLAKQRESGGGAGRAR